MRHRVGLKDMIHVCVVNCGQVKDANSSSQMIPATVDAELGDRPEAVHNSDNLKENHTDSTPEQSCTNNSFSRVNDCMGAVAHKLCKFMEIINLTQIICCASVVSSQLFLCISILISNGI